jgi:hypothetical protein
MDYLKRNDMKFKLKVDQILLFCIIGIGVILSLFQYLSNRSLWLDESYLALNLIKRNYLELLKPLDNEQIAPILFLFINKFIASLFNYSEYGLRLLSLICFWVAIYFFYLITKILFNNYRSRIIALLLFISNLSILFYSSEFKQYMMDVLMCSILYFLSLRYPNNIRKNYIVLSLAGVLSVFLSNITPIIFLSCGVYLFINTLTVNKQELKYLFLVFSIWFFSFLTYYLFFIHNHPSTNFMREYWGNENAFLPQNFFSKEFYVFLLQKFSSIYNWFFGYNHWGFLLFQVLIFYGFYAIILKKDWGLLFLVMLPLFTHLCLSSFKMYPFDHRLILYSFPLLILLVTIGIDRAINKAKKKLAIALVVVIFYCSIGFFIVKTCLNMPLERSEVKKCLSYLNDNIQKDDIVYFSFLSRYPIEYYSETTIPEILNHRLIIGKSIYNNPDEYLVDIKQLKGRVWFVFLDFIYVEKNNKDILESYLLNNNIRQLDHYKEVGVSVFLVDIK